MDTRLGKRLRRYSVRLPDGEHYRGITDYQEAKRLANAVVGSRIYERGKGIVYTNHPPIRESLMVKFLRALIKLRECFT